MQQSALVAVGLAEWRYQLLPVPPALFEETIRALPAAGFRGINVTIPYKERALAMAHSVTERARAIGAANTLLFDGDGSIQADNTDAPGLIAALPFSPQGVSALVLGAGGSARAAVWGLLDAGAREVFVWNRTRPRAAQLAAELGASAVDFAPEADLLVNCTSAGLNGKGRQFKELPVAADQMSRYRCVVDLVYTDIETELVRAARTRSIAAVDGITLLVAQGALSFEQFTGIAAPVTVMETAVRESR